MNAIPFLSALTLAADALIVLFILSFAAMKNRHVRRLHSWVSRNSLLLAAIVALSATVGSLFISDVMGWEPCKLCWLQRIFMYPLVILLGIAAWKKDHGIWRYAIPLAVIGSAFSIYHYYIQRMPADACSLTGVSCAAMSFAYGYISIPVMALSAFIMIILLGIRRSS